MMDEEIFLETLPSEMKCYIISKKDYVEKQALIMVNYGSADTAFEVNGRHIETPDGIAHFLEHKLFEDRKRNIFDEFTKIGGSVNAFTNNTSTAYYFNCIDNFDSNLKLLLDFIKNPYFTDKNVEKEKGIISQEIEMYNDNPFWIIHFNLLEAIYKNNNVKKNIAGSIDSINTINKDLLYECYNAFYRPSNMVLVCVGDFVPEEILEKLAKWSDRAEKANVKKIYEQEPELINKKYIEKLMPLARPMFNMGYKDSDFELPIALRIASSKVIMDIALGESSLFFENLYNNNLVDGTFMQEFTCSLQYGAAIFSNSCDNPQDICERIHNEIENIKLVGISEDRFEQIRKKHIGRIVRSFNNIDAIAVSQADFHFKGMSLHDLMEAYKKLNMDSLEKRLNNLFKEDNYAISVIKPV